ncbi:MAG: diguanylate cyclase [Oscillospiraceae bacterium]
MRWGRHEMNRRATIRVYCTICGIIILGFCLVSAMTYSTMNKQFRRDIEDVSKLNMESIYANINYMMEQPINVSVTMANDTFLRDFIADERSEMQDPEGIDTIKAYLASYQEKYKFNSVFLVSAETGAYYHYKNGIDRILTPQNPENTWYYDFLADPAECSLNVDNDEARENIVTIFVNCKLSAPDGTLLGVVGVGLETSYIQQLLEEHESEYGIRAYLIDSSGTVQVASDITEFAGVNLFAHETFAGLADEIIANTTTQEEMWYDSENIAGYRITKYVPGLNWYLVIEKSSVDVHEKLISQFMLTLLVMALILVVVVATVMGVLRKHDRAMLELAGSDQLTGIRNRASYEQKMALCATKLTEYNSFGIAIFDLNHLKKTNDEFGHLAGDEFIKDFSSALCNIFHDCPVYRIGGDEFAVILLNISEHVARERFVRLEAELERCSKEKGRSMSAAHGCAYYDGKALSTTADIFRAADRDMYLNKKDAR